MPYIPPAQRKINAALALLASPPAYDPNPIFAKVPPEGWASAGYQFTLTVQWSNVAVDGLDPIVVRAHVHYRWVPNDDGGAWVRFAGNAWISGLDNWQTATTPAVVAIVPDVPNDPDYHP